MADPPPAPVASTRALSAGLQEDTCEAAFLRNLTGGPITVQGDADVVHLPPLGEVEVPPQRLDRFDEEVLATDPRVQLFRAVSPEAEDRASAALGLAGVLGALVGVAAGLAFGWGWRWSPSASRWWWAWWSASSSPGYGWASSFDG